MAKKKKKNNRGLFYITVVALLCTACWFHDEIFHFFNNWEKHETVVVDKVEEIQTTVVDKVEELKEEVAEKVVETKETIVAAAPSAPKEKKEVVSLSGIDNLERPAAIKNRSERVLKRMGYVTSYNKHWKLPNWVAWKIDKSRLKKNESRTNEFLPDPDLRTSEAVTTNDYKGSGFDRGHMCPAADNRYHWKAMQESFYMTNICPQDRKLNSGDWNDLEEMCRFWAEKEGSLYVVCGPIVKSKNPQTIGRKQKVVVPDAFFKVILSTAGKQPRAVGFVFENKNTRQHLGKYARSVDEIEAMTGINFFPALPDEVEVMVEKQYNLRSWGLN